MEAEELYATARMARLTLTPAEVDRLRAAVGQVLAYFSHMREIDVEGLEPTTHALLSENRLREDRGTTPASRTGCSRTLPSGKSASSSSRTCCDGLARLTRPPCGRAVEGGSLPARRAGRLLPPVRPGPRPVRDVRRFPLRGPALRAAFRRQGQHRGAVFPPHVRVEDPARFRVSLQRHGRGTSPEGGGGGRGQDQPRRVRHGFLDRELGLHGNAQPLGPGPRARRLERRLGRGRGCRHRPFRAGDRHGRLGAAARRVLRRLRPQADLRSGFPLRPGGLRLVAGGAGHRLEDGDGPRESLRNGAGRRRPRSLLPGVAAGGRGCRGAGHAIAAHRRAGRVRAHRHAPRGQEDLRCRARPPGEDGMHGRGGPLPHA